ncbi:MAG: RcnB family protein, partial [Sphingopyxis sp.]
RAADSQPTPTPQPHYQPQPRQRYERPNRPDFEPRANRDGHDGVRWNPRGDDSNARTIPNPPVDRGQWQGRRSGGNNANGRYRRHDNGGGLGSDILRDARSGGGDVNRYDRDNWDHQRHDRDGRYDRNDNSRYDRSRGYGGNHGYDGNRRYERRDRYDDHHGWNRDWRHDRRYDWFGHRNHYRDQYRWGIYYSPYRNWNYRRISIGFSLWPLFYSDRYWINDPWSYRLPDAYGPYRWVRYYDDALLVDVRTGEVVDVIDNFFW